MSLLTLDDYLLGHCGPAEDLKDGQYRRLNATAKVLDFAAEAVDSKMWIPRKPVRPQHTCAVAAICEASRQPLAAPREIAAFAYLALQAQVNHNGTIGPDAMSVTEWNDTVATSKAQVTEAMNNAAHFLRRYAKGNVGPKKAKRRRRN